MLRTNIQYLFENAEFFKVLKTNKVFKSQQATKQRDTEEEEKISGSHRGRCPKPMVSTWQGLCDSSWLFPQQRQRREAAGRMVPVLPFLLIRVTERHLVPSPARHYGNKTIGPYISKTIK